MVDQEAACKTATQNSPFAAVSAIPSASVAILEVQNRRGQQLNFDFADYVLKLAPSAARWPTESAHIQSEMFTELLLAKIAPFRRHNDAK